MYKKREDQLESQKRHYKKHPTRQKKRVLERKRKIKKWIYDYKLKKGCCFCDETYPYALDFHHVVKEKNNMRITEMVGNGFSPENILKEIDKCKLICCNCHRKIENGVSPYDLEER
jgi:predicted amino acid dehydrogenase